MPHPTPGSSETQRRGVISLVWTGCRWHAFVDHDQRMKRLGNRVPGCESGSDGIGIPE